MTQPQEEPRYRFRVDPATGRTFVETEDGRLDAGTLALGVIAAVSARGFPIDPKTAGDRDFLFTDDLAQPFAERARAEVPDLQRSFSPLEEIREGVLVSTDPGSLGFKEEVARSWDGILRIARDRFGINGALAPPYTTEQRPLRVYLTGEVGLLDPLAVAVNRLPGAPRFPEASYSPRRNAIAVFTAQPILARNRIRHELAHAAIRNHPLILTTGLNEGFASYIEALDPASGEVRSRTRFVRFARGVGGVPRSNFVADRFVTRWMGEWPQDFYGTGLVLAKYDAMATFWRMMEGSGLGRLMMENVAKLEDRQGLLSWKETTGLEWHEVNGALYDYATTGKLVSVRERPPILRVAAPPRGIEVLRLARQALLRGPRR